MPTIDEILAYERNKWLKTQETATGITQETQELDRAGLYQKVKPLGWSKTWQESSVDDMKEFLDARS